MQIFNAWISNFFHLNNLSELWRLCNHLQLFKKDVTSVKKKLFAHNKTWLIVIITHLIASTNGIFKFTYILPLLHREKIWLKMHKLQNAPTKHTHWKSSVIFSDQAVLNWLNLKAWENELLMTLGLVCSYIFTWVAHQIRVADASVVLNEDVDFFKIEVDD